MNIVITGNTRGIGLAFTRKFFSLGDKVIISSRTESRVSEIVDELSRDYEGVFGTTCDVRNYEDVERLAVFATENLGSVDIWINNAGTRAQVRKIYKSDPEEMRVVVETNVIGTLYGSKSAINTMLQQGYGHIFNMEGFGSDGRVRSGLGIYGASKRSIPYITKSLSKEMIDSNIGIHSISPGMVLTNLLVENADTSAKRIFNILAEHPKTVAEELVPRIRDTKGSGNTIRYLSKIGILWRFLTAWKRRNRFFDKEGNYIYHEPIE